HRARQARTARGGRPSQRHYSAARRRCRLAGMTDGRTQPGTHDLPAKISRLIEERGWSQSELARISRLNLQTVRQILMPSGDHRPRNATIAACARALGLTVSELRTLPLERLIARIHSPRPADSDPARKRLHEEATQPELLVWLERNPERAARLTADEVDELLSLQGTGGPLTSFGVEHFVGMIERKRDLID